MKLKDSQMDKHWHYMTPYEILADDINRSLWNILRLSSRLLQPLLKTAQNNFQSLSTLTKWKISIQKVMNFSSIEKCFLDNCQTQKEVWFKKSKIWYIIAIHRYWSYISYLIASCMLCSQYQIPWYGMIRITPFIQILALISQD